MANTLTPFGFRHFGYLEGYVSNYALATRKIAAANGTAIFKGDPVTSLNTGYIAQSTAGTTQIAGIFQSCEYLSTSQQRIVRSVYWPGSDATGDVKAFIINSPQALFIAQSNGSPILLANVGNNANFALTQAGNTTTGYSGATIDQSTILTTATLPFRIYALYSSYVIPGDPALGGTSVNGADNTTNFNMAVVAFNFQDFRSTTGI
jgi:hypothetical protein